jgi:hypothetical protein
MNDFNQMGKMIFNYTDGGQIMAGGYQINSNVFLPTNKNMIGGTNSKGEETDEKTNNSKYIIPFGLIKMNAKTKRIFNIANDDNVLSDDIYDNLLRLVNVKPTSKKNYKSNTNKSNTNKSNTNKSNTKKRRI